MNTIDFKFARWFVPALFVFQVAASLYGSNHNVLFGAGMAILCLTLFLFRWGK